MILPQSKEKKRRQNLQTTHVRGTRLKKEIFFHETLIFEIAL